MSKIRFLTKTAEDGRRLWRIEGDDSATPEDIDGAISRLYSWLVESQGSQGSYFELVREPGQFRWIARQLSERGYSKRWIAQRANTELLAMLAAYLVEFPHDARHGEYSPEEAIPVIVNMVRAVQWLRRAEFLLAAARPAWSPEKRQAEINQALDAMTYGKDLDRECLIDRDTIRRALGRKRGPKS